MHPYFRVSHPRCFAKSVREGGRAAVESYTELKTVLLPFTDEMM